MRPTAMRHIADHGRGWLRDRRGGVLIEFIFALPILVVVVIGSVDVARYVLLNQKMDRAASTMADLVSRPDTISQAQIDVMFAAAEDLLTPFDMGAQGRVIMSSVSKTSGNPARVDWQHENLGGLSHSSNVGAPGNDANLPSGFTVSDGENLIVAEVFFNYEPIFFDYLLESKVLGHTALRRPRRGDLSTLN